MLRCKLFHNEVDHRISADDLIVCDVKIKIIIIMTDHNIRKKVFKY